VLEAISNVLHYNPDFKTLMGGKIFRGTHLKGPKLLRPQFLLLLYIFTVRNVQDSYMFISEKIWVKRSTLKCFNGKLWHECVDIFSHIFSLNNPFNGILSTDNVEYFVVNIQKIQISLMNFRGNQKMDVCIVWILNSDRHISLIGSAMAFKVIYIPEGLYLYYGWLEKPKRKIISQC
jgi:hypothetical protein